MDLNGVFSTFIETDGDSSPETSPEASQALAQAVRRCRTCVTRGPVLHWILDGDSLKLSLCPGLTPIPEQGPEAPPPFFCLIKTEKDSLRIPLGNEDCLVPLPDTIRSSRGAVLLLFLAESCPSGEPELSSLTAAAGPVFFSM